MTLRFLRALCLRYPIVAGGKIGPITGMAIRKTETNMTKDYTGKRVEILKPIMTHAKNTDGTPAGIRTFGRGTVCTCTEHTQGTGDIWQDGFMRFTDGSLTFGGYMEGSVRDLR